jgi:hypothetical protein
MTSKSSSSVWRLEKVARTWWASSTDALSFSCTNRGAVTQSEANMASCPWFRYWREIPPRSSIAVASASRPLVLYTSTLPCSRHNRKARMWSDGANGSGSGVEA